jgi:adenine deaminase
VGADDKSLANAINLVIHARGGVAATDGEGAEHILLLPVAGIMSDAPGVEVAKRYTEVDAFVKHQLSTGLKAPFMTLSFMALLVIPQLKLSDKGLFDGGTFRFVDVTL